MTGIPFRRLGIGMIVFSAILLIILSVLSFTPPRNPSPHAAFETGPAPVEGWRVEQNYACMDCHTILGNGAYFAPDLTKIGNENGPAWLRAWLDNSSAFPDNASVQQALPAGTSLEEYYAAYPGAAGDVQASGGNISNMPLIRFSREDKEALVPFMMYLGEINTNGWPPSADNKYSFADTFQENSDKWPESFEAWAGYWILGVTLVALVMFSFFYWHTRGDD